MPNLKLETQLQFFCKKYFKVIIRPKCKMSNIKNLILAQFLTINIVFIRLKIEKC